MALSELEWLTSDRPGRLLSWLTNRTTGGVTGERGVTHLFGPPHPPSERKLRLLAVACCRVMMPRPWLQAEADSLAQADRLADGGGKVRGPLWWIGSPNLAQRLAAMWETMPAGASCELASMLREIIGNPFRLRFAACGTRDLLALAQAAYNERRDGLLECDRLAVTADALEDAGCDDAGLLAHLRSADPHPRGCWALDLVLGKE